MYARSHAIAMNRFVFLIFLSAVQLALSADVKIVYGTESERSEMRVKTKNFQDTTCGALSNEKKRITTGEKYEGVTLSKNVIESSCLLVVDNKKERQGIWSVNVSFSNGENQVQSTVQDFQLIVKKKIEPVPIRPTKIVTVVDGNYIIVHMPHLNQEIESCTLLDQNLKQYILTSDKSANMSLHGKCGVRMKASKEHNGDWRLYAHSLDDISFSADFRVIVAVSTLKKRPIEKDEHVKEGRAHKIEFVTLQSMSHCTIFDPSGKKVIEHSQGSCFYNIPLVTSYHNGTWEAEYMSLEGNEKYTLRKRIFTYDDKSVFATVYNMPDGSINLICEFKRTVQHCLFERPDEYLLPVHAGVGNDKYEYYGQGFGNEHSEDHQECGITIRSPTSMDMGMWKCIADPSTENQLGTILQVYRDFTKSEPEVHSSKKVYVLIDNSFQIKCSVREILDYCWIQSPNGTNYQVSSRKKLSPGSLPYNGAGLTLGECGATVQNANSSDNGDWICHMGLRKGAELTARVAVKVTETPLIAEEENIVKDTRVRTLSCTPLPGAAFNINYCRWIKPDGTGFHYDSNGRYFAETHQRYCKLTLTDDGLDNDGRWTCIAGIMYDSLIEHQAYINVSTPRTNYHLLSASMYVVIVALTLIGVMIYRKIFRPLFIRESVEKPIDVKYLI